jgi:hypothetical protein
MSSISSAAFTIYTPANWSRGNSSGELSTQHRQNSSNIYLNAEDESEGELDVKTTEDHVFYVGQAVEDEMPVHEADDKEDDTEEDGGQLRRRRQRGRPYLYLAQHVDVMA